MVIEMLKEDELSKVDYIDRFLAKFIDLIIVGAFFSFPTFIGSVAGLTYLLIADGLRGGQGLGKKIARLKVISLEGDKTSCSFKESILRNIPFGLILIFYFIPYLKWILIPTLGLAIVVIEALAVYEDAGGLRWGDRIAHTMVVYEDDRA